MTPGAMMLGVHGRQAGFTLLEMLIVLIILGMAAGLVIARGPMHSDRLDMQSLAQRVAGDFRLARSDAIGKNRLVFVTYNASAHTIARDGVARQTLPAGLSVAMVTVDGQRIGTRVGRIGFLPDGSSTGGRVILAGNGQTATIGVDWLTGRVSTSASP